jgi:hypothetical protein
MPETLKVTLDQSSIVDTNSGEVSSPEEIITILRELEGAIQRADERVGELKDYLKMAKEEREHAVEALRAAVRGKEVQSLPLFDEAEDAD